MATFNLQYALSAKIYCPMIRQLALLASIFDMAMGIAYDAIAPSDQLSLIIGRWIGLHISLQCSKVALNRPCLRIAIS